MSVSRVRRDTWALDRICEDSRVGAIVSICGQGIEHGHRACHSGSFDWRRAATHGSVGAGQAFCSLVKDWLAAHVSIANHRLRAGSR